MGSRNEWVMTEKNCQVDCQTAIDLIELFDKWVMFCELMNDTGIIYP
jgi:hypothetical protein